MKAQHLLLVYNIVRHRLAVLTHLPALKATVAVVAWCTRRYAYGVCHLQ